MVIVLACSVSACNYQLRHSVWPVGFYIRDLYCFIAEGYFSGPQEGIRKNKIHTPVGVEPTGCPRKASPFQNEITLDTLDQKAKSSV